MTEAKKVTVTERLYTDADGKPAKAGSPDAAFLAATPGDVISAARASELGLSKPAAKQVSKPIDKQVKPARNKGRAKPASKSKG